MRTLLDINEIRRVSGISDMPDTLLNIDEINQASGKSITGFGKNIGQNIYDILRGVAQIPASAFASIADPGHLKEQAYARRTGEDVYYPHIGDIAKEMPRGLVEHFKGYVKDPLGKIYEEPVGTILDVAVFGGLGRHLATGGVKGALKSLKAPSIRKTGVEAMTVAKEASKIKRIKAIAKELDELNKIPESARNYPKSVISRVRLRQELAKLEAESMGVDLTGKQKVTPKGAFMGEAGAVAIPTQTEISQAGTKIAKFNLWDKYIGTPVYNLLGKGLKKLMPEKVQRIFTEKYKVPKEFTDDVRHITTETGLRIEDGYAWAEKRRKAIDLTAKEKILRGVTAKSREGVEALKGTEFYDDAKYIESDLSRLWDEVKGLGLSTSEFFEGRYLPKLDNKSLVRELARIRKNRFSGRLKKRGESRTISRRDWDNNKVKYESEGWEVSKELANNKVQIRKFVPYGEIQDPYVLYAKGVADLEHDIGLAKIIKGVAKNPKWAKAEPFGDFVKLGDKYHLDAKFAKVNNIRDMYVHPEIARDLGEMIKHRSDMRKFFDKSISLWKVGKTAYNPATHVRNIVSNMVLADMGGLSIFRRFDIYGRAAREMYLGKAKNASKYYTEAKSGGLFGKTFYDAEIKSMLGAVQGSKSPFDMVKRLATGKYTPSKLYQFEEEFSKFAKFIHNRQRGLSIAESVADAHKWLFDYSQVSPFVGLARRTVAPFITFQAKAFPRILETAIKHPLRIGKYVAAYYYLEGYAKRMLGLSDEEYENVRKNAPDYIRKGGQWLLMPERDENGDYQFFNLTFFMPWGDMISGGGTGVGADWLPGPIEQIVIPNNPIVRLPYEIAANKSFFSGRELWKADEPKFKKGAKHVLESLLPPTTPGVGYHAEAIRKTTFKKAKTYFGEDIPRTKAVEGLLGLRKKSVNIQRSKGFKASKLIKNVKELESRLISVANNQNLTASEKARRSADIKAMIKKLVEEYRK